MPASAEARFSRRSVGAPMDARYGASPFRARTGMPAFPQTPVLPDATRVGALFAQSARSWERSRRAAMGRPLSKPRIRPNVLSSPRVALEPRRSRKGLPPLRLRRQCRLRPRPLRPLRMRRPPRHGRWRVRIRATSSSSLPLRHGGLGQHQLAHLPLRRNAQLRPHEGRRVHVRGGRQGCR
jgi:hypothetical protein